jgi:hypothetical protein
MAENVDMARSIIQVLCRRLRETSHHETPAALQEHPEHAAVAHSA